MDAMRTEVTDDLGFGLEAALLFGLPPTIGVQQSRREIFSSFYDPLTGEETGVDISQDKPYFVLPENMRIKQQPGQPGGQDVFLPQHVLALAETQGSDPALMYEMQERALNTVLMHYDGLTRQELAGIMEPFGYDAKHFDDVIAFFEQYMPIKGQDGYFAYSKAAIEEAKADAAIYRETPHQHTDYSVPVRGNGKVSEPEWPLHLEDTLAAKDIKERLSIVSPPGKSSAWSRRTYEKKLPHLDLTYDPETGEILTEALRNIPKKQKPEYHVAHLKRFKEQEREALFNGNGFFYQTSDGREPTDMLIDPSLSHDHDEFHELEVLYAPEIEAGNQRYREQEALLYAPPN